MEGFCWYGMTAHRLLLRELVKADKQERMNIFRRYFASSRFDRLLIQQTLVRSAQDNSLVRKVLEMEKNHSRDFMEAVKMLKECGYFEEFLIAVREEDQALSKIVEAYDKRMNRPVLRDHGLFQNSTKPIHKR
jgi:hypothetical protein